MRLPHITIEYREEESFGIGKMSPELIVGFGVHWAWVYLVMFNGSALFFQGTAEAHRMFFGIALFVFCAVFLSYAALLDRARRLFSDSGKIRRNRRVGTLAMAIGTAALFGGGLPGVLGGAFSACAAVLVGFGSVVLLMSYGVSFSVCDVATCSASFALSLVPATLVFSALLALNGAAAPFGALCCVCLPFIELFCLNRASSQLVDKLEFTLITVPVETPGFPVRLGLPCLAFGMIVGALRTHAVLGPQTPGFSDGVLWSIVLAGAAACLLVLLAMLTQRQTANFMFRTMMPLIALVLAVCALSTGMAAPTLTFLLFGAYLVLEGCLWIMLADLSQRYRISAFTVFGYGRGFIGVGSFVTLLLMLPGSPVHDVLSTMQGLVAVAFVLMTLGYSLLPKPAEIRHALKRNSEPAMLPYEDFVRINADDEDAEELGLTKTAGSAPAGAERGEAAGDAAPIPGANLPETAPSKADPAGPAAQTSAETPVRPLDRDAAGEGAPGEARSTEGRAAAKGVAPDVAREGAGDGAAPAGSQANGAEGAAAAPPVGDNDRTRQRTSPYNDPRSAAPRGAAQPGGFDRASAPQQPAGAGADADSGQARLGRYKRKCAAVADAFLLSRKETEVLFLLAKGHNAASIQEALYISAGTANTHMRHIYRKLDVHSQQDLIRLVESMDVD